MEVTVERPSVVEGIKSLQKDTLESTREEIGEVKQENERLKMILSKITNDYQSLQTQLLGVVNKGVEEEPPESAEESEMVSLSLGTSSWRQKKEVKGEQAKGGKRDFSLCVGTQSSSSHENSLEDAKEEEIGEIWPPSKALKAMRSGEDEISESIHVRKARVSVRARCDAPTMNDGCQWRKYGQKIAKGNPCPRAYYRCTISPGCPVRKQVQRCAEDTSILITTYEGIHNHPLPIAATSMASTTSAAAGMLASGPLSSRPSIPAPETAPSSFNFSFLDDSKQKQLYPPNASITSSPSHATITLDLTSPPYSSHSNFSSRFSHSSFSFSAPEGNPIQATPQWNSPFMSYGSQIFNSKINLASFSQQPREIFYHPHAHKQTHNKSPLPDSIAAATKVITADPGFQTALAAAITSAVGGGKNTQGMTETLLKNLRWSENLSAASTVSSATTGNGCSYIARPTASTSSTPENGEIRFLKPSLSFSGRKSAASSPPADSRL